MTTYRVMIACPSDVDEERKAAIEVIYDWNALNEEREKVVLLPVTWETHATPQMGDRPQAIINKQLLPNADILIGIFWTRLGTPTGVAESGTAEEIEKFSATKKPTLIYFSDRSVPATIDLSEFQRVRDFKDRWRTKGLFGSYKSIDEFKQKISVHLTRVIDDLKKQAAPVRHDQLQSRQPVRETDEQGKERYEIERLVDSLKRQAALFTSSWTLAKDTNPPHVLNADSAAAFAYEGLKSSLANPHLAKHPQLHATLQRIVINLQELRDLTEYHTRVSDPKTFWRKGIELVARLNRFVAEANDVLSSE